MNTYKKSKQNILVMYSTDQPSEEHLNTLSRIAPDHNVVHVSSEAEAVSHAEHATIILGHRYLWQVLPYAKQLEWVQSSAAGIDHLLTKDLLSLRPILTTTPIFADVIAFHAISLAFTLIRKSCSVDFSGQYPGGIPRKVMILGTGHIGKKIAKFLRQFDCDIIGVNTGRDSSVEGFDKLIGYRQDWKAGIGSVDILFISLPNTPETKEIVDLSVIDRLKEHACIVNVGRGTTIDHHALLARLETGKISAGLDVVDSVDQTVLNRLRLLPNVIITPKTATFHPERRQKFEHYAEEQLQRYILREPLRNIYEY